MRGAPAFVPRSWFESLTTSGSGPVPCPLSPVPCHLSPVSCQSDSVHSSPARATRDSDSSFARWASICRCAAVNMRLSSSG